ncbi:HAD family hydrolase [Haloarcula salina]|uniref:phosphoserine phosphatase n=1 Tax=Haloarcula salina TaxID=1429914 RepID=A0AA41G1U9_9EURY|nr:HAD-IB family phosphatase [Haloarcula salina]MBV0902655.1 HAD-IB family phosphatase [Haloarcula salina]
MTRLVVFDLDGTLTRQRGGFELLHTLYGTAPVGEELQDRFDAGALTFDEWCRETVDHWRTAGISANDVERAAEAVTPKAGAPEVLEALRREGVSFGILSAGVANLAARFERFGPAFVRGNRIRFEDGSLAGIDVGVGPTQKGEILREIRRERPDVEITYVGDSHTDTEAFVEADSAILFDPDDRVPPEAVAAADSIVESSDIRDIAELRL